MSMADKMYKDGPTYGKDEKGKATVSKKKESVPAEKKLDGAGNLDEADGMPVPARHAMERREMHHRHETEHSMNEGKNKSEMHKRHEEEMKMMHKRHEKSMGEKEMPKKK